MTSPHPPSSLGSCVYTLYLRWSLLHVRWSTLSGWSLVVTGQPLLASSKSCQLLISVIFSRRERRAIEAFEKRSSGGGGVGQILFHFHCQTHFHCGGGGVGQTLFHQKSKNVCQRHSLSHSTVFYHTYFISSCGRMF